MSTDDGKRVVPEIAAQLRAQQERIAELEKALFNLVRATDFSEWIVRKAAQEVLAKAGPR